MNKIQEKKQFRFKSKVSKMGKRKVIEVPKAVRDYCNSGDEVKVEKVR